MKTFKLCPKFRGKLVEYCKRTSIHGLRYVIDDKMHYFERCLWLVVFGMSSVGACFLFAATWANYVNNPISFVVETTYLHWNTSFPSITICQTEGDLGIAKNVFGKEYQLYLQIYMMENVFFHERCTTCSQQCMHYGQCPDNITEILEWVNQYRATCQQMLTNCSWNYETFDCCAVFQPINTQFGRCYAFNSKQTKSANGILDFKANRLTGPRTLEFFTMKKSQVYLLTPYDTAYISAPLQQSFIASLNSKRVVEFTVTDMINDPLVEEVPIQKRQCRFPKEILHETSIYPYYSHSVCAIECLTSKMREACGCVHHLTPGTLFLMSSIMIVNNSEACSISQRGCIDEIMSKKNLIEVQCHCLSSCEESEYRILGNWMSSSLINNSLGYSEVRLSMLALPSHRYVRNVVRTKLDLVVSLGGAAGLFLGASLLTIVEFFYYLFIYKNKTVMKPGGKKAKLKKSNDYFMLKSLR